MIMQNTVIDIVKYNKELVRKYPTDLMYFERVLISVNPVYDWFMDNANDISYRLIKAFITNIVPLGQPGKKYFKAVANKKRGATVELWKLYNAIERRYWEGNLKTATYSELTCLGYAGICLGGDCPVDDIFKFIGKEAIKTYEALRM